MSVENKLVKTKNEKKVQKKYLYKSVSLAKHLDTQKDQKLAYVYPRHPLTILIVHP